MILTYRNVADWLKPDDDVMEMNSPSDEASTVGMPSSSTQQNSSQNCQQPTDKPPFPELRFEIWWLFYAASSWNTSHQNTSRWLIQQACAFNENCGLAVWPDFGSAPQGGCVDQRKGQKSAQGSEKTWCLQDPAAECFCFSLEHISGSSWYCQSTCQGENITQFHKSSSCPGPGHVGQSSSLSAVSPTRSAMYNQDTKLET